MFALGLIETLKSILAWLYNTVGIKGIIILGLMIFIAFQHLKLDAANDRIITLTKNISDQNTAIDKANKAYEDLNAQLSSANKLNDDIKKQYDLKIATLKRRPIATTCEGAMLEVRNSAKAIADKWNAK